MQGALLKWEFTEKQWLGSGPFHPASCFSRRIFTKVFKVKYEPTSTHCVFRTEVVTPELKKSFL